jgi:X-Pro dipeptidyl-peptidase
MRVWARGLAAGAVTLAALALGGPAAHAQSGPGITIGSDGETAPVFSYADAIRERVFIPVAGVDQNADGVVDRVAIDIIRPKESGPSLKVPAIVDDSPYYTSVGRGNETQFIHTTTNGNLDFYPLFYDNYFVPRGYAVILAQAIGTAFSTGCPLHGGPGDVAGFKAVIDWLEGRIPGYTTVDGTTPAVADWANGKNAMIGKSYDGTFANGVAATGVQGLTTIVPLSAISNWYDYSRMGGIRENTHYPNSLDNSITENQPASVLGVVPPDHNGPCQPEFTALNGIDGDDTGDMNAFWNDRDYLLNVNNVKAAVFESHGINDDNVRPKQFAQWWAGLAANNVPRKLWLSQEGHVDPFDYRRDGWVDTLHRWFDYWLQGVPNGIMNEPRVDIERTPDVWETDADWPLPSTQAENVYLQGSAAGAAGKMGLSAGGATDSLTFKDASTTSGSGRVTSPSETTQIANPTGSQAARLVFETAPLTHDLHISGTPYVDLFASIDKAQSNIGAMLVDYGTGTHVNARSNEGVRNTTTRTCVGDSTATDSACYLTVTKVLATAAQFRISKGILDSSNRDSLSTNSPVTPGQQYEFRFDVLPTDYVVAAGHQLGLVVVGNYTDFSSIGATTGATFTVDTKKSRLQLPVVGGYNAAVAAGGFTPETVAPTLGTMPANIKVETTDPNGTAVSYTNPTATDNEDPNPTVTCTPASGSVFPIGLTTVTCTAKDANGNTSSGTFTVTVQRDVPVNGGVGGTVPATLSLTLGPPATFGAFTPGVAKDYTASMTGNVISTAGDALLSVSDPSSFATGHLVNGTFFLPSPLQARARNAANQGTAYNNVGSSASPLNLLTWSAPISNDALSLDFAQHIGANDALRTGSYSKTLTFTLSTTTP